MTGSHGDTVPSVPDRPAFGTHAESDTVPPSSGLEDPSGTVRSESDTFAEMLDAYKDDVTNLRLDSEWFAIWPGTFTISNGVFGVDRRSPQMEEIDTPSERRQYKPRLIGRVSNITAVQIEEVKPSWP